MKPPIAIAILSQNAAFSLFSAFSLLNCSVIAARFWPFALSASETMFAISPVVIALKPIALVSKSGFCNNLVAISAALLLSSNLLLASSAIITSF